MIRVASYCRVSTDKDDQVNSFEMQQHYFRDYIEKKTGWELYDVYADEGITGTSTKNRNQFNRMIKDAREGKFQLIITKEVSRFSRNILDTISYTRELKAMGVAVLFMTDGINTMEQDAELRLAIMASIAQEESRRTSNRVTWGQTRQMEKGIVFGHSMLGYDVKEGRIAVNQDGAEIVKLIFQKYAVEQVGATEIARFLTKEGYRTYKGNSQWRSNTVIKILRNEKYAGDLIQKKTYTPDFLTHEKRKNKGEIPLISIWNHHEPVISREIWNLAQERLQRNYKHRAGNNGHSSRYAFSGKIICGECGATFVGRWKYQKDGTKVRRWRCATTAKEGASVCDVGKLIRDDDAIHMLKTVIQKLQIDFSVITSSVALLALDAIHTKMEDQPKQLRKDIDRIRLKREAVMDSYFNCDITREEMQTMRQKYGQQLEILNAKLAETVEQQKENRSTTDIQSEAEAILCGVTESEVFYKNMLESLTVFKDRHMELRLKALPQVFWFEG